MEGCVEKRKGGGDSEEDQRAKLDLRVKTG